MGFSITSISPESISSEGGGELTITGTFEILHQYRVHVGNTGTTSDPVCYSGVSGQGNIAYPTSATTLKVRAPLLSIPVTDYSVTVIDVATSETHNLDEVLTVLKKQFYSLTYAYRKLMHKDYKVGPRTIDLEELA